MKDLTKGNIYKNFFVFAFPMVLAGVLSQGYQTINTVIAGKFMGEQALAAIGAVSPFDTFINGLFWGFSNGAGIYVARLFGGKRFYRLKTVILNNFLALSATIIAVSIITVILRFRIYDFLNIDKSILSDANKYFLICTLGKVFTVLPAFSVHIYNALGDSGFPFYMSLLSAVLNVCGNLFTVTVLKMGVVGLALSTVFSAFAVVVCYIFKMGSNFKRLGFSHHKVKLSWRSVKETLRYSIPVMFQQGVLYFGDMILSPLVNSIGASASASYTVALRVYDVNAAIYQNSAKTVGNYTAQCFGAQKYDKLKKGLIVGFMQNLLFVLPILLVCVFLPKQVCSLFYSEGADSIAYGYTVTFLRCYLPLLVFNVIANLFHHFFRGVGKMGALLTASLMGMAAKIALTSLLINRLGMNGFYIGWAASWIFDAAFGFILYLSGGWKKNLRH